MSLKKNHTENHINKGGLTRQKIIHATRKVLSEYPYNSASIRMIGKEGGFEYPLTHYYFKNKAELFEVVAKEICEEIYKANVSFFEGIERMSPREGLSSYIDRFLDYNFKNPQPLRIIALNIAHIDNFDEVPGYKHYVTLMNEIENVFKKKVPLKASAEEVSMYVNSLIALIIAYLGLSSSYAQILGMKSESDRYRIWVKKSLMSLFLPWLEKLIFADQNIGGRDIQ
jgi:AcrR family transcriptional regulator